MPGLTVVIGVTGTVGSRVATKLAAKGIRVRGVARDVSHAPQHAQLETVKVDATDAKAMDAALRGAEAVYLTPPEKGEDPLTLERNVTENVIVAAKRAGVKHLILHTALQADHGNTGVRIIDNKTGIERALTQSGIPYTILRPAWFMQNLFGAKAYIEQGALMMPPTPERRFGAISVEDIAESAVRFFQLAPQNRGFDLHVPNGVTGPALAEAATRVLNRQVQYQPFPGPVRQFVDGFPISEPHKELYAELFEYFKRQDYLGRPDDLTKGLPGFAYTPPERFMRTELFA